MQRTTAPRGRLDTLAAHPLADYPITRRMVTSDRRILLLELAAAPGGAAVATVTLDGRPVLQLPAVDVDRFALLVRDIADALAVPNA